MALVPAPPARATVIGSFPARDGDNSPSDYIDYTMINASSTPMIAVSHSYEDGRTLAGNELYDHSVLTPGDYAEYASHNEAGMVGYRWALAGTKYQVLFRSYHGVPDDEYVQCIWTQDGDYEHEITDVPYTCAVSIQQGQYGHTTEYMTVADKDLRALDEEHQALTLQMADKLCADSNNGKSYELSCTFDEDLKGTAPKPVQGKGLPTLVAKGQNCLTDRDVSLSTTKATTISNTVGWQETTKVGITLKYAFAQMYSAAVSLEQSFAYSSSTTSSSTDSNTYSAPMEPQTGAEITVVYPVLKLSRDLHVRVAHTELDLKDVTITLREPDSTGAESVRPVAADC